jgi:FKBP-type peptidyl-prolyl cis-trans isomerase
MKNLTSLLKFGAIVLLAVVISSCGKNDPYYTPAREATLMKDWLDAMVQKQKDIDTTSTGLFYIADKVGTGATVQTGDTVTVKYTGMFMDGTIFDASAYQNEAGTMTYIHKSNDFRMIQGWEEGIEVLNKGASAVFLIPSAKAYGPTGYLSIPPYSPLIFVIEVVDIK